MSKCQLFPIKDEESWAFYKKQRDAFWFPAEIDYAHEADSLALMNETERRVLLSILAFFAGSDAVVNEKLALSLYEDSPTAEACMFNSVLVVGNLCNLFESSFRCPFFRFDLHVGVIHFCWKLHR